MTDYRSWCKHCGELTLSKCYCPGALRAEDKYKKEQQKRDRKELKKLISIKRKLLELGYVPELRKTFDHDKREWLTDRTDIIEYWVNSHSSTISVEEALDLIYLHKK
jgi:hypothetical protein